MENIIVKKGGSVERLLSSEVFMAHVYYCHLDQVIVFEILGLLKKN